MRARMVAITVLLFVCTSLDAKKPGHANGNGKSGPSSRTVVFATGDVRMIQEFYGAKGLPPGIQKQLIRKGTLPPGIAKKIAPFPVELDRRLPPLPAGVYRGTVGGAAILYDPVDRIIFDVADIIVAARRL